jgi:hypothetical protein
MDVQGVPMSYHDIEQIIGPSAVMPGVVIDLQEAIRMTQARFPDRSFCVVNEWVWLDLDAPELVVQELALEGKKPVMLLMLNVVFNSSTKCSSALWQRSSPLVDFSDGMFFETQNKVYVLINHGRRKTMSLSALVRAL